MSEEGSAKNEWTYNGNSPSLDSISDVSTVSIAAASVLETRNDSEYVCYM
jgi:hypothetical protein